MKNKDLSIKANQIGDLKGGQQYYEQKKASCIRCIDVGYIRGNCRRIMAIKEQPILFVQLFIYRGLACYWNFLDGKWQQIRKKISTAFGWPIYARVFRDYM